MAKLRVPVVPEKGSASSGGHNELDFRIVIQELASPHSLSWWESQYSYNVPESIMGWLVAQGWQITAVDYDNTTNPPTAKYSLYRAGLRPALILQSLCNSFRDSWNNALLGNQSRYNDIVIDWGMTLAKTHDYLTTQTSQHNADFGLYITDLGSFMGDIDELSEGNVKTLKDELKEHEEETRQLLIDLGKTDRARINEEYAAKLSVQIQELIDSGLYTSVVKQDITTRNHRDRDEQIQMLNDRLNREKLANEHQLYGQQENLADHRHRRIVEKMNAAMARLEGQKSVAAENRQLMAYQLDEYNKLVLGLYSFVERRTDIAPEWKDMASMIAGLGDAAGGWITP